MTTIRPAQRGPLQRLNHPIRRLVTVCAVAPLLALAACSGGEPITSTTAPAAPTKAATSTATGPATTTSATTSTTTPAAAPTRLKPKGKITDDVLGHVITPTKIIVGLPWPEASPVGEEHFDIVGVEVKVVAGKRYSATVTPAMFTLKTASGDPVPYTNEFNGKLGKELGTVKRGATQTGWLLFKVEKGNTSSLQLQFNRPSYQVSTTDKSIKAKTFSLPLAP